MGTFLNSNNLQTLQSESETSENTASGPVIAPKCTSLCDIYIRSLPQLLMSHVGLQVSGHDAHAKTEPHTLIMSGTVKGKREAREGHRNGVQDP